MTNPTRDELMKLVREADTLLQGNISKRYRLDRGTYDRLVGILVRDLPNAIRRLASSDSGVKGEPEPEAVHVEYERKCPPGCISGGGGAAMFWGSTLNDHVGYARGLRARDDVETVTVTPLYTAPPADAGMREALGWLIEKDNPPVYHLLSADYDEQWTGDAGRAVRFAREEDAQAYVDHVGWTTPPVRVVEHMWPALTAPGATTKSDGVEGHVETWDVRVTDERDTNYNDAPVREVLMPDGEWRECIAVDDADARKTMQDEWAAEVEAKAPCPSDPSSTRSEVTVEELARDIWLAGFRRAFSKEPTDPWENQGDSVKAPHLNTARAVLEIYQIGRK